MSKYAVALAGGGSKGIEWHFFRDADQAADVLLHLGP